MFGQTNVTDSLALDSIEAKWEKMIDEVTVVAHRPVVKFTTDKVNYRVKDDPDSKTQTVLEMLRKVVSRVDIQEKVWHTHFDTGTNFIDVYINYLRKKVDHDFSVKLIKTKPGIGFILTDE